MSYDGGQAAISGGITWARLFAPTGMNAVGAPLSVYGRRCFGAEYAGMGSRPLRSSGAGTGEGPPAASPFQCLPLMRD